MATRARPTPSGYDDSEQLGRMPRRRFTATEAIVAMIVALAVGALLGSASLVGLAQRQEVGTGRDIALGAAETVDRISNFFSLNIPAERFQQALGRTQTTYDLDEIAGGGSGDGTAGTGEGDDGSGDDGTAGTGEGSTGADPSATPAPATPPPAPTPAPPLRTVTAAEPLRLYVGGDSMAAELGTGIARVAPVDIVRPDLDGQVSSGLSRPDFLDWPQRLAGVIVEKSPDVYVVMFGANDYQNVEFEGRVFDRFGDEWFALYRTRVAQVMDLLDQPGSTVVWVGQPVMRDATLNAGIQRMNAIFADEAASRPWITFVDTASLFAGPDGGYRDHVDGQLVRQGDGVHLTLAGVDRMGAAVWQVVAEQWGL